MAEMMKFPETDWKTLRSMKDDLVRKAYEHVLRQVEGIVTHRETDLHKAYLELWRALKEGDAQIGLMFDDLKRSNARLKIFEMIRNGILSPRELEAFTEDTRESLRALTSACGQPEGLAADE